MKLGTTASITMASLFANLLKLFRTSTVRAEVAITNSRKFRFRKKAGKALRVKCSLKLTNITVRGKFKFHLLTYLKRVG